MNCPACGHTLSPGARFCNKCGTLVSQVAASAHSAPAQDAEAALAAVPAVATNACPQCGKAVKVGVRFCTACGTLMGTPMPAAQPTEPLHGSDATAAATPMAADEEVDLSLSFDDTRPPEIDRAGLLESLPLHPVQRGMPDFELPEPRPQPTTPFQAAAPQPAEPVTFDDFDGPDDGAAQGPGGADHGAGLKWAALALVVLLVAGGGWWGYRHFAHPEGQPAAGAEAAQPAIDDVAEGESVVPSEAAADAASEPFDSGEAAAAAASDPSPSVPLDAVAAGTDAASSTVGSAQADVPATEPAAEAVAPVHVLQDQPASQAPAAPRKRSGKQSLDSLLD